MDLPDCGTVLEASAIEDRAVVTGHRKVVFWNTAPAINLHQEGHDDDLKHMSKTSSGERVQSRRLHTSMFGSSSK